MAVAAIALSQLLQTCAPNIGERTMTAIVRVESGGNYLAIRDNDVDRTFSPVDAREAVAWSTQLLRLHHSIDLGIAQINSANLDKLGMSLSDAFDPCINLHGGATILSFDYGLASRRFGAGQFALRRAIGAYNTGSIFAGESYVNRILVAAGVRTDADVHVPDVRSLGDDSTSLAAGGPPRPLPADVLRAKPRLASSVAARPLETPNPQSAFGSPILVPVGTSALQPQPATGPAQSASLGGVQSASNSATGNNDPNAAPILTVVAAPVPSPSPAPSATAAPAGLSISRPFDSPIVLNLAPAALPLVVRPPGGAPYITTRPSVLINMTLLPSPSPAPSAKPQ